MAQHLLEFTAYFSSRLYQDPMVLKKFNFRNDAARAIWLARSKDELKYIDIDNIGDLSLKELKKLKECWCRICYKSFQDAQRLERHI